MRQQLRKLFGKSFNLIGADPQDLRNIFCENCLCAE